MFKQTRGTIGPLTGGDVHEGEQPHARVPAHRPLLGLTVGAAAVVHKAGGVPSGPCIDDAILGGRNRGLLAEQRGDIFS